MRKNKHLSIEEHFTIKSMLDQSASCKAIARFLGRNCTTLSKEVQSHLIFKKTGYFDRLFNDCANRFSCPVSSLYPSLSRSLTSAMAVRTEMNAS